MGELRAAGYRWDTGPSVITMRHVIERLFTLAKRRLDDYVEMVALQPITRYFWPDGAHIDAVADPDAMAENVRALAPKDVDGYVRFMRYARTLHDVVAEPFLYRSRPGIRDLLQLPITHVLKIDALRSMHAAIRSHVRDPHLIQLLSRFATYNGSSPYRAPATLNVIAHVELAGGAYYPRGGVFTLAKAYERLATELNVDIRYATRVSDVRRNSPAGYTVQLATGTTLDADAVVINADYSAAQRDMLPTDARDRNTERRLEPSCSALALLLAVHGQTPELAHHNILFCSNYPDEFDALFTSLTPPSDPTLYVCITAKTDPDHAPSGNENWFVLANAPYLSDRYNWANTGEAYARGLTSTLTERLSRHNIALRRHTLHATITPDIVQDWYGGNRGALYGFSSNSRWAAFLRPPNRSNRLKGVYYASGSAHPGGGVPLVTLSGIAAADCAARDLGLSN